MVALINLAIAVHACFAEWHCVDDQALANQPEDSDAGFRLCRMWLGGATSIDVTKPGIDKAYGIGKLRDTLHLSFKEMVLHRRCIVSRRERLPGGRGGCCVDPCKRA